MGFWRNIKRILFDIQFEVGERVYWDNTVDDSFCGEYVVTSRNDHRGLVGVYNEEKKNRFVSMFELEHIEGRNEK